MLGRWELPAIFIRASDHVRHVTEQSPPLCTNGLQLSPSSFSTPWYTFFYFSRMASIQDRTHEFKTCVESIRSRSALGNRGMEAKQRLLQNRSGTKSEFSRIASTIGKEISSTSLKLNKLGQRMSNPCAASPWLALMRIHSRQAQDPFRRSPRRN
jgi:hypothetical protein